VSSRFYKTIMQRVKHSGNAGDLIYSLPAMQQIGQPIELTLVPNVPLKAVGEHPNNGVQLTYDMCDKLRPLLFATGFIKGIKITEEPGEVDYDFDLFRKFHNYTGHISQWYFHTYPKLTCDLSKPIEIKYLETIKPSRPIVLNRTARYHNPTFDYSVLKPYQDQITFVGLPQEFKVIQAKLPGITYSEVPSFLVLAGYIYNSELFIGNQSMAYAIAEIMKVDRILEVCPYANNVIPTGEKGYGAFNLMNLIQIMKLKYG
jgi:hypothetical protein